MRPLSLRRRPPRRSRHHGRTTCSGSYGAKDWTLRGAADRLDRALSVDDIEHDIEEYPDAGHAFLNDHRDPLSRAMRVVNMGYHEPSAKDTRQRIITFFGDHLKSHAPPRT